MTRRQPSGHQHPTTIGDLIALGEHQFDDAGIQYGQGTLNAWDEARWLALAALDLPLDSPIDIESKPVTQTQCDSVLEFFRKRIQTRMPAAYITGTAWLKGYAFHVDPRVIIPRSFIAELILDHFTPWVRDTSAVHNILDLCTGSGCLAIMAADHFPNARVTATDISDDALAVAHENVVAYGLEKRVHIVKSDVFSGLEENSRFDLIISNPPYVPESKRQTLPPEFRNEPEMALIAADHGMAIVRNILAHAAEYLGPQGILAVEIGHEREACEALLAHEFPGLHPVWIETDEQSDNVFMLTKTALTQHTWRPTP